jgi:hypothetical protein
MFESIYAEAFLDSLLNGDATLTGASALNGQRAYKNRAPQGTKDNPTLYPLVIYNMQAGGDVNTGNASRIFTRPLFQVRAVGKVIGTALQDASRVRTAAHRMDELLKRIQRRSFTVDGATYFFNVWREDELPPREEPGESADVFYRNYSGLYRVEVFT